MFSEYTVSCPADIMSLFKFSPHAGKRVGVTAAAGIIIASTGEWWAVVERK